MKYENTMLCIGIAKLKKRALALPTAKERVEALSAICKALSDGKEGISHMETADGRTMRIDKNGNHLGYLK